MPLKATHARTKTPDSPSLAKPPRDLVGAVAHVMTVLRAFDENHVEMTLSEVSRRTGLDRAGARRYLLSLAYLGYVIQRKHLFRLSPKILELGEAFLAGLPIAKIAQNYLDAITQQTQQTCAIAILDDDDVVYIARAMPNRVLALNVPIGSRNPALSVSTGRVLLAFAPPSEREQYISELAPERLVCWRKVSNKTQLSAALAKIRTHGYAIVDQEFEAGVRAIAAPIIKSDGSSRAALCIVTNASAVSKEQLTEEFFPLLQQAATELAAISSL
jgi:IclR family transcriptional regulator, pca regulon regulatory protein